jgi:hypothetical protein
VVVLWPGALAGTWYARAAAPGGLDGVVFAAGDGHCALLSASLGRVSGVGAAAEACGAGAALPVPKLKVKPPSLDLFVPSCQIQILWSARWILLAGEWCWCLVPGKPTVSASGHDEGDATGAAHLLEALLRYLPAPLLLCLGEIPGSSCGRRRRYGVAPLLGGAVLGTALVVVEH